LVVGTWLLAAALWKAAEVAQPVAEPPRIEIRDGTRRIWLDTAEILWVEAAGNYVELHLPDKTILRRQTLSAIERELASMDFLRIHRSRLVNARHVSATETNDSGDFTVILHGGKQVSGSRRWRGALEKLGGRGRDRQIG
jgi:DNA-binding LytR/AlgR family response regulator